MEDIFYFSPLRMALEDMAKVANDLGYIKQRLIRDFLDVYLDKTFPTIEIGPSGEETTTAINQEFWHLEPCDWTSETDLLITPHQRTILEHLGPKWGAIISFRHAVLPELIAYLERVLDMYSGWVLLDTDWVDDAGNLVNIFDKSSVWRIPAAVSSLI